MHPIIAKMIPFPKSLAVVLCGILLLLQQNPWGPERESMCCSRGLVGSGSVPADVWHQQWFRWWWWWVRGAQSGQVLVEKFGRFEQEPKSFVDWWHHWTFSIVFPYNLVDWKQLGSSMGTWTIQPGQCDEMRFELCCKFQTTLETTKKDVAQI